MFVFVNPKFNLPKWLKRIILFLCGVTILVVWLQLMLSLLGVIDMWVAKYHYSFLLCVLFYRSGSPHKTPQHGQIHADPEGSIVLHRHNLT